MSDDFKILGYNETKEQRLARYEREAEDALAAVHDGPSAARAQAACRRRDTFREKFEREDTQ